VRSTKTCTTEARATAVFCASIACKRHRPVRGEPLGQRVAAARVRRSGAADIDGEPSSSSRAARVSRCSFAPFCADRSRDGLAILVAHQPAHDLDIAIAADGDDDASRGPSAPASRS
jgi:hypothetical protein